MSATGGAGHAGVSGRWLVGIGVAGTVAAVVLALSTRGILARNLAVAHPAQSVRQTHQAQPVSHGRAVVGDATWGPGTRAAPGFSLYNQNGQRFTLASQRGQVVVLTFMDSSCTTLCPLEGAALARARRMLPPATPVELVVVSTAPAADTPASVQAFARRWNWPTTWKWQWLTASAPSLEHVRHDYGISVASDSSHTAAVYVISRRGYERAGFGVPFPEQSLAMDINHLVATRAPAPGP